MVFERESARPAEPHPEGSATKLSDDAALVWTSDFARAWLIMHAPRSQPSAVMREISNAVNAPDQPASSARSGCGEGEAMSVRELKAFLRDHKVDFSHCVEKSELRALVAQLQAA